MQHMPPDFSKYPICGRVSVFETESTGNQPPAILDDAARVRAADIPQFFL
jgi:hypothetical protein